MSNRLLDLYVQQLKQKGTFDDRVPRLDIQKAADLYWHSEQQQWDVTTDFPNIAPPWKEVIMRWRNPGHMNKGTHVEICPHGAVNQLVHLRSDRFADLGSRDGQFAQRNYPWIRDDDWFCVASSYMKFTHGISHEQYTYVVDQTGRLLPLDGDRMLTIWPEVIADLAQAHGLEWLWSHTLFLALSLCHCKNVTVEPVVIPPKLKAKAEKRGLPKVSYSVIEIEPMRRTLKAEGGLDEHGSVQKALHICRGHFKDYRERPLFGKYAGIYWWDAHVRGSANNGVAVRDYRIGCEPS
jgi:hypothetical protein